MKNKILQEFLNSNIKIKSTEKLIEYIHFCIKNDIKIKTSNKTEHHHILPKAKTLYWTKYKDIKKLHKWNGVHLSVENHTKAHYILALALDEYAIYQAYIRVNGKDENINTLRIKKMKEWHKNNKELHSNLVRSGMLKEVLYNGEMQTKAKIASDKGANTRKNTIINGKSLAVIGAEKSNETQNNTIVEFEGVKMTIKERSGILQSKTKNKIYYRIIRKGKIIMNNIKRSYIKLELTPALLKTSKDSPLGTTINSKRVLNKYNKLDLIGCYIEPIL